MKDTHLIYEKIQNGLRDLPGEPAHLEMFPKRRGAKEAIKSAKDYKTSAVLALLHHDESTQLTLTQRQDYDGTHSGQISFPGGKMEASDANPLAAALRETKEEIGLGSEQITILGGLTDVFIPVSNFLVHPYIGYYNGHPNFTRSEREVKEIFSFDIELLTEPKILQKRSIKIAGGAILKDIPCFIINDKIVWGATALMLNEIKQILIR